MSNAATDRRGVEIVRNRAGQFPRGLLRCTYLRADMNGMMEVNTLDRYRINVPAAALAVGKLVELTEEDLEGDRVKTKVFVDGKEVRAKEVLEIPGRVISTNLHEGAWWAGFKPDSCEGTTALLASQLVVTVSQEELEDQEKTRLAAGRAAGDAKDAETPQAGVKRRAPGVVPPPPDSGGKVAEPPRK